MQTFVKSVTYGIKKKDFYNYISRFEDWPLNQGGSAISKTPFPAIVTFTDKNSNDSDFWIIII